MNIRTRITLIFISLVTVVLTMMSLSIYFFSANHRKGEFYRRLKNRASNTANILVSVKEVNAGLLRRMEKNNPAALPSQYIAIFNDKYQELYSSDTIRAIAIRAAMLQEAIRNKEIVFKDGKYEVLAFLYADHFVVVAAAEDSYGRDVLSNLRNVLMITFAGSLIFVSIIGWIYAGRVLSPISKLVDEVSKISEISLDQRLEEGNQKDELNKLAATFNRMLERLQGAFLSQKNFIANASHEIKTPLTVMSGEIEVALLQERDKSYYVKILRSVLNGLKGLNKLSTHLLLLAQTSADHPVRLFSPLRIDDMLWEAKEELLKAHPEYSIEINLDLGLSDETLLLNGDENLIRVALSNLLDNGCKYSEKNEVQVELFLSSPKLIAVKFTNQGTVIEPEAQNKIFEPFFRGTSNKKVKGFGIGLSLVHKIIQLHHGELTVESNHHRTNFTMTLPVQTA
jgi:signal transduction histidine kinase